MKSGREILSRAQTSRLSGFSAPEISERGLDNYARRLGGASRIYSAIYRLN
jgi:hypothetical protein